MELDEKIKTCESWYLGMDKSEIDCEYTEENTGQVGLITDPANHVIGNFSDSNYTITIISDMGESSMGLRVSTR